MRQFYLLVAGLAFALGVIATSNNLTDLVTWDKYSLMVNSERQFIFSGEFHYQRLPMPELWLDVFQKYKAMGLNMVSFYFFWSYHSPSKDTFDFTTPPKDIQRVLDYAKEAGLWVIARPGPYCNAETSAGGLALWTTDGSGGDYRTDDPVYREAWLPWVNEVSKIIAKNQISEGGPVILLQPENEFTETTHDLEATEVQHMIQLQEAFRDAGIVVPFTSNEKGMRGQSWSVDYQDVGGAVDIYGLDSYPGGLSCTDLDTGFNVVRTYYQWFQNYSYSQPSFTPEFEGGWFSPWGGSFYDQCEAEHQPEFADVYYKDLIGQHVVMINLYMAFGGTNWGHSAAPVVYTSYDYSAPLRETRQIWDKFKQTKLIALFTRVSPELRQTYMESNGTGNAVDSDAIWTWVLRNPSTDTGFYLAEKNITKSREVQDFTMTVQTSAGEVSIPTMQLNGRQSRFVVTDYSIGNMKLLYSSSEVLTYGLFDHATVMVFYLDEGQVGEFAFKSTTGNVSFTTHGAETNFKASTSNSSFTRYSYTQGSGSSAIRFSNGVIAWLLTQEIAWNFYAPPTIDSPNVHADEHIFALGPYLVRSASVSDDTISIIGDNDNSTVLEIFASSSATQIIWNGAKLATTKTSYGSLTASIPGTEDLTIDLPYLDNWLSADTLPEKSLTYDDSAWTIANHTTTLSPVSPLTLPVLFSSDYSFYPGIKLYRGYFPSTSKASGANITVQAGDAAGWSAWLNGVLVGGHPGNASLTRTSSILDFSTAPWADERDDNVLLVVTDYSGHDQTSVGPSGGENPRGIMGAYLTGGNGTNYNANNTGFTKWKIQGNAGGNGYLDPLRGPMNEGGLYGERLGWHLPGFSPNTSSSSSSSSSSNISSTFPAEWKSTSPLTGLSTSGISWYTTTFTLSLPTSTHDIPLGLSFTTSNTNTTKILRLQLFINGWQFGKYWPSIGPQSRFPLPPGVLKMNGINKLDLSLWSMTDEGAKLDGVELFSYGVYESGFGFDGVGEGFEETDGYAWDENRLKYA